MSKLAREWIQKNFSVKQQLEPLERCLADGYVLVSICHQQGLIEESEFEGATNTPGPETAGINLKILAKALRKINIKLTRSDVAAIITEQSGFAPSLVMEMKKEFEVGDCGKGRARTPEYKKAIKSLRPHQFIRATKKEPLSPRSQFLTTTALTNPDLSNYRQTDPTCQFDEYEIFRYQIDEKEDEKEKNATLNALAAREDKYAAQVTRHKAVTTTHKEKTQTLTKNWKSTQRVKRDRRTRDTQFEMAVQTHRDLKKLDSDMKHTREQIQGIENFEHTLKRSGLGGTDDSRPLAVSYEDAGSYLARLEELTIQKLPTKEETNDFILNLKTRTAENRMSRLEKARRKRRMLVEQLAAQNAAAETANLGADDVEELDDEELRAQEKVIAKAERDKKLTAESREAHAQLMETAEDKLRVFLESQRLLADDDGTNVKQYQEVIAAQKNRRIIKSSANREFCKAIVFEMVKYALVECVREDMNSAPTESTTLEGRDDMIDSITDTVRILNSMDKDGSERDRQFVKFSSQMKDMESWPVFAGLSLSVGSKRVVSELIEALPSEPNALVTDVSTQEDKVKGFESREPGCVETSLTKCTSSTTDQENIYSASETKFESTSTLVSSIQAVCESILLTPKNVMFPHIKLSNQELTSLVSNDNSNMRVVLVLGQGNDFDISGWKSAVEFIGGTFNQYMLYFLLLSFLSLSKPFYMYFHMHDFGIACTIATLNTCFRLFY